MQNFRLLFIATYFTTVIVNCFCIQILVETLMSTVTSGCYLLKLRLHVFLNDGFLFPMEKLLKLNTAPTISRHLTDMFRNTCSIFNVWKNNQAEKNSSRQSCVLTHSYLHTCKQDLLPYRIARLTVLCP